MTAPVAPDLSERDYEALARFRWALRVFQRFSEEAARAEGLTPAQHQLLLAIRGWGGSSEPDISGLAERLQLRHHSVVELVQRAEAAGLLGRSTDPGDHRRQRLALTERGAGVLRRLSRLHREELRRFRAELVGVLDELG